MHETCFDDVFYWVFHYLQYAQDYVLHEPYIDLRC